MSKKLLTEFFELCKDGICQALLTEREKREVSNGAVYLSGRIQAADTPNGNGRVYPKKVLPSDELLKEFTKMNRFCCKKNTSWTLS